MTINSTVDYTGKKKIMHVVKMHDTNNTGCASNQIQYTQQILSQWIAFFSIIVEMSGVSYILQHSRRKTDRESHDKRCGIKASPFVRSFVRSTRIAFLKKQTKHMPLLLSLGERGGKRPPLTEAVRILWTPTTNNRRKPKKVWDGYFWDSIT